MRKKSYSIQLGGIKVEVCGIGVINNINYRWETGMIHLYGRKSEERGEWIGETVFLEEAHLVGDYRVYMAYRLQNRTDFEYFHEKEISLLD